MTAEVAKQLVGAWRYVGTTMDGVNKPRGNDPKGLIWWQIGPTEPPTSRVLIEG